MNDWNSAEFLTLELELQIKGEDVQKEMNDRYAASISHVVTRNHTIINFVAQQQPLYCSTRDVKMLLTYISF